MLLFKFFILLFLHRIFYIRKSRQTTIVSLVIIIMNRLWKFRPIFEAYLTNSNITTVIIIYFEPYYSCTQFADITDILFRFYLSLDHLMVKRALFIVNRERSTISTIELITFSTYDPWNTGLIAWVAYFSLNHILKCVQVYF